MEKDIMKSDYFKKSINFRRGKCRLFTIKYVVPG